MATSKLRAKLVEVGWVALFLLSVGGWVRWEAQPAPAMALAGAVASAAAVAVTEELLFMGFVFQRLLSFGVWLAQLLMSGVVAFLRWRCRDWQVAEGRGTTGPAAGVS